MSHQNIVWVNGAARKMQRQNKKSKTSSADAQRAFFAGDRYQKLMAATKKPRVETSLASLDVQSLSETTLGGAETLDPTHVPANAEMEGDFGNREPPAEAEFALPIARQRAPRTPHVKFDPTADLPSPAAATENRIKFIDQGVDRTEEMYATNL